jgi:hypothetical protein
MAVALPNFFKEHFYVKKSLFNGILLAVIILSAGIVASAQKKPAKPAPVVIAGVYGDFTVGKESGDLEGMRVVLFDAGNEWHAIVQIAQGGAEDPKPEYVPVAVKGNSVEFKVGEMTFKGTVTTAGLKLKHEDGMTETVKRQSCSSFFKY